MSNVEFEKCASSWVKGFIMPVISSVRVTISCLRDYYKAWEQSISKCTGVVLMHFLELHPNTR